LSSKQPGWQIFCRPRRHCCLCQFVRHTSIGFGHRNSTSYPVRPIIRPRAPRAGRRSALPGPIKISSAAIVRSFISWTSADFRRSVFMQPQGTCPRKRAASDHHGRTVRGSYILNATASGNHLVMPRRFRNLPIFSLDLTATSAALCIQHPDEGDDRSAISILRTADS
jgi:hypothetical protein